MLTFLLGALLGILGWELLKEWLDTIPHGFEDASGFHFERRTLPRRGIAARGTGSRAAPDDSEAFVAIASQGSET